MQKKKNQAKNNTKLEEYLVYEDRLKLNTLQTTLKVRQNGAYLALIGVDSKELAKSFQEYLLTFDNTKLFNYSTEQIMDEILQSNEEKTFIVDIYNLPTDFQIKNIVQHFRFNRDFIPNKKIRIFILASNETLDLFSEKAYDFVTFNNFYGKFKDNRFDFEYQESREALDKLIKEYKNLQPNTPKTVVIDKILYIVQASFPIGDNETALKYLKIALSKAKKLKNSFYLGTVYNTYGMLYWQLNNESLAIQHFENALKQLRDANDKENEIPLFVNLGSLYCQRNDFEKAEKYFEKAEKLKRFVYDKSVLISIYLNKGINYSKMGKHDLSLENYQKVLTIAIDTHNKFAHANVLSNIASLYAKIYDYEKALKYINLSNSIAIENSITTLIVSNLYNQGQIYYNKLDFEIALKFFDKALELCRKLNDEKKLTNIQYFILKVQNILNGIEENNIETFEENSDKKEDQIRYLINESIQLKEQKKYTEAKEKLNEAEKLADEINLKGLQCEVYIASYDYYRTIEENEKAQYYYNKANYIIKNSGHKLFEKRLEDIKNTHDKNSTV